jgi:Fe2+ transport system protein FeoA
MIFNFIFGRKKSRPGGPCALCDLAVGQRAIVGDLEMSAPVAEHLMNLGMVPGQEVTVARTCPGGDPCVYRVEGTEIAMRRELSSRIQIQPLEAPAFGD